MGLALVTGALFARMKKYRAHAGCQSAVVLLNLVIIFLGMAPSFRVRVAPRIPGKLIKPFYLLATAHAALGTIAEIVAIYIVLAAGTKLLPKELRLRRYKPWMRSALALWWLALLLGVATYARWYLEW